MQLQRDLPTPQRMPVQLQRDVPTPQRMSMQFQHDLHTPRIAHQAINDETAKRAATIVSVLTGNNTHAFTVTELDPVQPPPPAEGEPDEGPKMLEIAVPELAVLRVRLDSVNATCGVIPVVRREAWGVGEEGEHCSLPGAA